MRIREHRRILASLLSVVAIALAGAACGGARATGGSAQAPSMRPGADEVRADMKAVGLTGFHAIPRSEINSDKSQSKVDPRKIQGAFVYTSVKTVEGKVAAASILVIVADPSVFSTIKATNAAEDARLPGKVKYVSAKNVLIASFVQNETARQHQQVGKVGDLIAYLKRH